MIAADNLKAAGINCLVLDKGRSAGGRLATRERGNLRFDHGAQAISAESSEFSTVLDKWNSLGILRPTDYKNLRGYGDNRTGYYSVKKGMAELPRFLAGNLDVKTSCRVIQLYRKNRMWGVKTSDNEEFSTDFIILTLPVPQSLELLGQSDIELPGEIHEDLTKVEYERCIALMIKGYVNEKYSDVAYIYPEEGPLSLIVNNHIKGVSDYTGALTVHSNPDFSLKSWNLPDAELIDIILKEATRYLHGPYDVLKIHRWRYSRAINSHPLPYLIINKPGLLAFAGDGFFGRDIEGAVLSGLGVSGEIISILN